MNKISNLHCKSTFQDSQIAASSHQILRQLIQIDFQIQIQIQTHLQD